VLNPDDLTAAWVAKLQDIPALVTALGGDPTRISGYVDRFPDKTSLGNTILARNPGSILVVYMGTFRTRIERALAWKHSFSFHVKGPESVNGGVSYALIWWLFVNGIPATANPGALKLLRFPIHEECYPMDLELPQSQRNQILVSPDGATMDVFEIQASLVEIGDN
jgi:hypothetical protein